MGVQEDAESHSLCPVLALKAELWTKPKTHQMPLGLVRTWDVRRPQCGCKAEG